MITIRFKFWKLNGFEDEVIFDYPYLPHIEQTVFYKGDIYKIEEHPTVELDHIRDYHSSVHCKQVE